LLPRDEAANTWAIPFRAQVLSATCSGSASYFCTFCLPAVALRAIVRSSPTWRFFAATCSTLYCFWKPTNTSFTSSGSLPANVAPSTLSMRVIVRSTVLPFTPSGGWR
jgi:hypothetical protein